jgi:hypothetical protein
MELGPFQQAAVDAFKEELLGPVAQQPAIGNGK